MDLSIYSRKGIVREVAKQLYHPVVMGAYVTDAVRFISTHPLFLESTHILAYEPMRTYEIPFLGELTRHFPEKKWYVPEAVGEGEMLFVSVQEAESGVETRPHQYRLHKKTCVIVPALAIDREGNRLGKGGGYYDRFLHKYPSLQERTLSVVPDFAVLDSIPKEEHDVQMRYVYGAHASV